MNYRSYSQKILVLRPLSSNELSEIRLQPSQSMTVGRIPTADYFIFNDVSLSGLHFQLEYDSAPIIQDLESSNGTFVNGKRINRYALQYGDIVVAGSSVFGVQLLTRGLVDSQPEPGCSTLKLI